MSIDYELDGYFHVMTDNEYLFHFSMNMKTVLFHSEREKLYDCGTST